MTHETLAAIDNRWGKSYEIPIEHGAIPATGPFIDGDRGILVACRGYPIDQLAEQATFLETAYLLLHGEL